MCIKQSKLCGPMDIISRVIFRMKQNTDDWNLLENKVNIETWNQESKMERPRKMERWVQRFEFLCPTPVLVSKSNNPHCDITLIYDPGVVMSPRRSSHHEQDLLIEGDLKSALGCSTLITQRSHCLWAVDFHQTLNLGELSPWTQGSWPSLQRQLLFTYLEVYDILL